MAFYTETIIIDHRTWFQKTWGKFMNFCEIVGYARAAHALAAMGRYEEAKHCMMQIKKLRD